MNYGRGKSATRICVFCGRGGARQFGPMGRAHRKCVPIADRKLYATPVARSGPWCPVCSGRGYLGTFDGERNSGCDSCHGTGIEIDNKEGKDGKG